MSDPTEEEFQRLLESIEADEDLSVREKKQLGEPVTKVRPDNFLRGI